MAMAQYDAMRKEIDELCFENDTVRKDLNASVIELNTTQERLGLMIQSEE